MLTLSAIAWAEAHNIASESVLTLPVQNELSRFDFKEWLNAFYMSCSPVRTLQIYTMVFKLQSGFIFSLHVAELQSFYCD